MADTTAFESIGRLPAPKDNAAIAIRRIEPGAQVNLDGGLKIFKTTILEGHRFAYKPIAKGEAVLSWGLPFGTALRQIETGESIINALSLEILSQRDLGSAILPKEANFENSSLEFKFDESNFKPGIQVALDPNAHKVTFEGYLRSGKRGTGTRNAIVLLGTSSQSAFFVRALAERLQPLVENNLTSTAIVPVAHTEGGTTTTPNNLAQLLRTLAGFVVHPNVGAVLIADSGSEAVNNAVLKEFMLDKGYPLDSVPHHFFSLKNTLNASFNDAEAIVKKWIALVSSEKRSPRPVSELKMGLQCGGSDAFSGISANPLIGAVGKEIVRHGGLVNLAETDELIGAETYILSNVKDVKTVKLFLEKQKEFKDRLQWHGSTIEGNPSGGNRLRGLYNIFLKSLGAATKKDPSLRLDQVIDYAEPMKEPGFTFMNSPGNDLESIAGQVGAGCNVICFTTGNGSVTNFPFVPTIKVTSTTRRHNLLTNEMDINAGAYLDGTSMDDLCKTSFEYLREIASGKLTKGEKAGHSQVSIWRNWIQVDTSNLEKINHTAKPTGVPAELVKYSSKLVAPQILAYKTAPSTWASERVGLIVATSMCSSQIARVAAEYLTEKKIGLAFGIKRFAALAHSEGCGFAGEAMYGLMRRTLSSYAQNRNATTTLFLEHGCEKIPNDAIRLHLTQAGIEPSKYGWASVQLDGGMQSVIQKIEAWFSERLSKLPQIERTLTGLNSLSLAVLCDKPNPSTHTAELFGKIAHAIVSEGGQIFISASDPLLNSNSFIKQTLGDNSTRANLDYGQHASASGFYIVATESSHWVENLSGLGGCGAQLAVSIRGNTLRPNHPFIPVLQISEHLDPAESDMCLCGTEADTQQLLESICKTISQKSTPLASHAKITDFQLTRGLLGIST